MSTDTSVTAGPPGEVATSLERSINWRGAFVIGLAGVILVTGITPFAVQAMGAAAIPCLIGIQVIALVVCLCMGELAALWPHRTGGTPSYAYESLQAPGRVHRTPHRGVSGWSYWLGWFPVAPINMILAASYIAVLFHVPLGRIGGSARGLGTPEGIGVLVITLVGLVVLFIPCYLGVRLGTGFATVLGIVSMVPITLLVILPVFKPSTFHWSNVSGFHFADPKTAGVRLRHELALRHQLERHRRGGGRLLRRPSAVTRSRDAKIALTAEGLYGLFIYAATAIVFVAVLGASLKSSDPLTALHQLRRSHLRLRRLGQVPDRHPAHRRPAAVGAQRHHGCGPLAVPGLGRPADPQVLRPQEQAPRSRSRHVLQPGLRHGRGAVRVAGAHLHLLQRGLPHRHHRGALRVLLVRQFQHGPDQPVPPARLRPMDRLGHGALPHLRLLRRRVGIAGHRGRPRARAHPLPPRASPSWPPTCRCTCGAG